MPFEFDDEQKPANGAFVFDDEVPAASTSGTEKKDRSKLDVIRDIGVTAVKGAVGLPQAIAGLADIPTLGRAGKALEGLGYRPDEAQKALDDLYSEATQNDKRYVGQADGFIDTLGRAIERPATIATAVGESIPQMLGGAAIARGGLALTSKLAPWVAGAIGEGVMGAGGAAAQIRSETEDGLLTPKQAAAAVGSGVGTAAFGALGGKLANSKLGQKLGIADVDTMLAQGAGKLAQSPAGFVKQVVGSGISEGVFEELPQSIQEQMWQNYATGKPLTEGVGNAAAMGMLAGAAMGGAGGGYNAAMQALDKEEPAPAITPGNGNQPANQAPTAASITPQSGTPGQVATGNTDAAEKALRTPVNLTALDRVNEIDTESARLQARREELSESNGYGPAFDGERADVFAKLYALEQERDGIAKTWPKAAPGAPTSFSTEAGVRLDGQYALMDAADLVTSHDEGLRANPLYPAELQPRDRGRQASELQVSGIVQKLDPARLGLSADAATGAPIVGADGLVESGNARTIALKRVYQANGQKAADYQQFLRDNAAQFGIDPAQVDSMAKPVLVRVRTTPVNRAEFARQANQSTIARMSPSEQATSDAKRLTSLEGLNPDDEGNFTTSTDFIRQFMATLPITEQSDMIEADGRLSTGGYRRVQNAVLAKAYGDSPSLRRMTESLDNNLVNISKSLVRVAPMIASARERMNAGTLHQADIAPDLLQAVEGLSALKEKGWTADQELAQTDLTGPRYTPESAELLKFLADNMRSPRRIAEFLQRYYEALEQAGDPSQPSMFGDDGPAPARGQLLTQAKQGPQNDGTDQNAQRGINREAAQAAAQDGRKPEDAPGRGRSDQGNGTAGTNAGDAGLTSPTQSDARASAVTDFKDALGDLAQIATKHTRASMVPENTPGLMPTLVKLYDAGIRIVGSDMKRAKKWVIEQLKKDVNLKTFWNKIGDNLHQKAAIQALEAMDKPDQGGLFDDLAEAADAVQGDLFSAPAKADKPKSVPAAPALPKLIFGDDAPPKDKPVVLVYGGSFNPIHAMHVEIARQARQMLEEAGYTVSTVQVSPSPQSLLVAKSGPGATSLTERTAMAKKAFAGMDGFVVTDEPSRAAAEITGKLKRTQQADWTREQYPDASVVSLAGADTAPGNPPGFPSVYSGDKGTSHEGYYYLAMPRDESDSGVSSSKVRKLVDADQVVPVEMAHAEVVRHFKALKGKTREVAIDGILYDGDAENFGMEAAPITLPNDSPLLQSTDTKPDSSKVFFDGREMTRGEMRDLIVGWHFTKHSPAPTDRKPVAYVMGGGGASGKGTIKKLMRRQGLIQAAEAIDLDPDEIKKDIPEYEAVKAAGDSRAASVVHEESSDLAKRIKKRAIDGRYDLILDVTLGDKAKGIKYLQELKDAGYEVHLFGVTIQPEVAVVRAMLRAKKIGRYVPISHLLLAHKVFNGAFESYAAIADQARLYENTDGVSNIAEKKDGTLITGSGYNVVTERSDINDQATTLKQISGNQRGQGVRQGERPSGRPEGQEQNPVVPLGSGSKQDANSSGGQSGNEKTGSGVEPTERPGISFVNGEDYANARIGQGGTEGEGTGTAQKPASNGQAERVRDGSGAADPLGNQYDDGRGPATGQVGQTAANGVGGQAEPGEGAKPRKGAGRHAGVPAGRDIPAKSGLNYAFGANDLTYEGSWLKKAEQNIEAVELVNKLNAEGRQATPAEQSILAKFIGWGSSEMANSLFGSKLDKVVAQLSQYTDAITSLDKLGRDYLNKGGGYRSYSDDGYYSAVSLLRAAKVLNEFEMPAQITRAQVEAAKPDASAKRWLALRDRLRAAMTKDQLAEASRSTQYAHYTSKSVVKSMWAAMERMGFKGGSILEPGAGIGVFPGLMPQAMAANSIYTGIEYDGMTGAVLKQLFPDERILVESFVDSSLPKDFYDVAVGNPPFSGTKILNDPEYAKKALSLHDYFFAKSIDRVKPGGLVVYVTSRYTLDKADDKARQYLAERADLVGAIRLPQTAFQQNAGTEVVTDVIFLRKKVPGETFEGAQSWTKLAPVKGADGKPLMVSAGKDKGDKLALVNEYFVDHPEMVLGQHGNTGSMYSDKEYTVTPMAGDIEAHFAKAVENLPADIYKAGRGSSAEAAKVREIDFNPKAKKEGNYYLTDAGQLMVREGGFGTRVELKSAKDAEIIKSFVPLRDALKQAHYDQLNNGDWETSLAALQAEYKTFTDKHGQINQYTEKTVNVKVDELDEDGNPTGNKVADTEVRRSFPLLDILGDDPDVTLVQALEEINDDTGVIKPGKFLSERVLAKQDAAQVSTPMDALLTTLNDIGHVDIGVVADRVGMTEAETIEALGTAIYEDPSKGWVMADEYTSGNVKRKLRMAREAAETDRRFERNVTVLEASQPEPLGPSQIDPRLGMNWIPSDVYEGFMREVLGLTMGIEWHPRTKSWVLDWESQTTHHMVNSWGKVMGSYKSQAAAQKAADKANERYDTPRYTVQAIETPDIVAATQEWGTVHMPAQDIMKAALEGRQIRIETKDKDGKSSLNAAETELAKQKLDQMHEKFVGWLFEDPKRTDRLVSLYNDKFNTTVARKFDGKHLTLPGTSRTFDVFNHVKRGAWRIIQSGNTYLAHAVGSGKTFQMVISAMEQKRLGLVKKPMMVVPNHMLKQFASEWQQLYPAARLMVADERNFHTDNRRRFVSRVALSDLDGVIITHSAFKLLDLDPEFKRKMIEEQLQFFRAALEEAGGDPNKPGGSRDPKIKRIEKQIENMEQKLEAAMSSVGKDKNVRFDELGVDFLYVDEAHAYRKLDFTTNRQVKGLSPMGSGQAFDLFMKTRYLEEKTPGRSLVLASGTPVTNTIAELYTVQKMLGYQDLVEKGIEDFDSWAAMFGREKTTLEPNAAGKYEMVTRFQDFANVPDLTQMFREFADVLTSDQLAEMLGDKRPKVDGGARKIVATPETAEYTEFRGELEARMERSKAWKPSKDEPNNPDPVIKIIGDGRLAAIDMRFMNPSLPSNPDSKLNRMIDDVIAAMKETADQVYRGKDKKDAKGEAIKDSGDIEPTKGAAMMVFSDLGFGAGVTATRGFNARAWFEKRLRDAGIAPAQVAFMSDYKKSADKLKLFKDVNAGRVRLLVGSSKNMGTGVNAQQRLKYMFHLDSPWFPADLEQREGRIIRQGNKNPLVKIMAYAGIGTYDQQMWGQLANKQLFIDKALSGDASVRKIEDAGAADLMAMAAGMVAKDPRVLVLAGLNAEIGKLQRLYQAHEDARAVYRNRYNDAEITLNWNEKRLPQAEASAKLVKDLSGDNFTAKVMGQDYTARTKFGEALVAKFVELASRAEQQTVTIGEISGFPITYSIDKGVKVDGVYLPKVMLGTPDPVMLVNDPGMSTSGVAVRAQNAVVDVARLPAKMRERMKEAAAQMDALREKMSAKFPMAPLLAEKVREREALEAAMAAPHDAAPVGQADAEMDPDEAMMGAAMGMIPPQIYLSRGSVPSTGGMGVKALTSLVNGLKAKNPNLPKVNVLADPSEAPKALREYINRQGAWNDVEGAMHEGQLYLFASGLADPLRAEHVLIEHEGGHYGLRAVLGDKLRVAMNLIYANNGNVRKAATELQKRGRLSNAEATEEVIVDIPTASLAKLTGWRKVTAMARDWLASRGYDRMAQKLTDWLDGSLTDQQRADLFVAELVKGARDYVAGKRPGSGNIKDTRLASSLADDIDKQEKWLQAEARERGYKDIEDLLEKNYPLFEKLATLWRQKNPADEGVMLSRSGNTKPLADRVNDILTAKVGKLRPLDAAARMLTKVTGVERVAGAVYDGGGRSIDWLLSKLPNNYGESIKAGVVADYGVPQAVIDRRTLLQGHQRVQLRKAGELVDKLSTLTRAESRVAYEWMNMDSQDAQAYMSMMQGLPEESVAVLTDIQKMIDQLSKEAINLGQLSPEAYERNKFAYLRRSYAKHILEQTNGEKAKRARVISVLGEQYKGRGMTESAAMDKIKSAAPEWWGRKLSTGKADTALKGEKFIRLERRTHKVSGADVRLTKNGKAKPYYVTRTTMADTMTGTLPGVEIAAADTKLAEVAYWPAGEPIPAKYKEWDQAGTWEVTDVKGPNAIFWRDFTKDEREVMGEVDEARFAIAKTLHAMIHDVEVGRYLEWVATTYAKKEGEQIPGEVVSSLEGSWRGGLGAFPPGVWVRVPESKIEGTNVLKYGKLAGRYVEGPVWNDLRQVVNGQFKPFGDVYSQVLSAWKTAKTALSPAVHMNNVMSNFVMADWHDVGASHVAKSLRILLAASQRDGKGLIGRAGNLAARGGIADTEAAQAILTRYTDSGGDIGSWVTNEIAQDQLEPLMAAIEKELAVTAGASQEAHVGVFSALQYAMTLRFPSAWEAFKPTLAGKVIGTEAQNLIDLYQSEDDVFRLAAWLKAKEDGSSDIEAGRAARKSFLDYNINAPWIQAMRQTGWPFISFTYRAVPMLAEIAGKKPHKLLKLLMVAGALNAFGVMMAGGDDDKERKLLPEEKAGGIWGMVPKLIRMPWNDAHGSPVYLDIRRFVPVGDVADIGAGHSAVPILPSMMPGGPLVIMFEALMNKSAFTGKNITLETDTPTQKATKVADHLYKAFAPNILGLPNTYATEGVMGSLDGRTDAFGREMSTAQAVASSFGIKLGSYPGDVMRRNLTAKAMAEVSEIQKNISGLRRQRQTNRIDEAEFQEAVKVETDKQRKVMKELQEKVR